MMRQDTLYQLGGTPFTLDVMEAIYPNCKQITDKARRLEHEGRIVRLKRGLYVRSAEDGAPLSMMLMANHIYGPSYVSLHTALRHYGLVPERVYVTESMCLKRSRKYDTPLGRFVYYGCGKAYFAIGIQQELDERMQYLVASPEKALCDLMTVTPGLDFRSEKELTLWLEQDLRMDMDALRDFDIVLLEQIRDAATVKLQNIDTLIKLLQ